jgi:hypothetical protein
MNQLNAYKSSSKLQWLFVLWVCLISVNPFVFSNAIEYFPNKLVFVSSIVLMLMLLVMKGRIILGDKVIITILLVQTVFSPVYALVHMDINYINIASHAIVFLLVYIFIINFISMEKVAVSFIAIFMVMGLMSIVVVLLSIYGLQPISSFQNPDGRMSYNYILTFSNAVFDYSDFSLVRPAGFFDEPGKLALYLVYILVINKLLNWSKKAEWVLIISGLFTLSLAFFISLVFYFLFFYMNKRSFPALLLVISVIAGSGVYINKMKGDSSVAYAIYKHTIWRIELSESEDKLVKGDGRSKLALEAAKVFSENKVLGYGRTKSTKDYENLSANIMVPFATDGIVGVFFVYLLVIYMIFLIFTQTSKSIFPFNSMAIKVVTIICMQYLQRPSILSLLDYLLIAIVIYLLKTHRQKINYIAPNKLRQ